MNRGLILAALVVLPGCLTARGEWRHQRYDVLPTISADIDQAYIAGQVDRPTYLRLVAGENAYRAALVVWAQAIEGTGDEPAARAEVLALLEALRAALEEAKHEQ